MPSWCTLAHGIVRVQAANTFRGAVLNALGYALAAYCVLKAAACLKSVLFGDDFTSDPASRVLGLAVRIFSAGSIKIDAAALSQYVTIAFVGFITFNSLRVFLKHIRRVAAAFEAAIGGIRLPGNGGGNGAGGGAQLGAIMVPGVCVFSESIAGEIGAVNPYSVALRRCHARAQPSALNVHPNQRSTH